MPVLTTPEAVLHYEVAGHGEPVLFLHGLGSSSLDWRPAMDHFAPTHRVIAIDLRGSGASRDLLHPSGPFSVRQFSRDAAALLEQLGAVPAHIVGLSLGGVVAFDLAVQQPRLVRTLTIVNSAPSMVVSGGTARAVILLRRAIARVFGPRGMAKMLAPKLFPGPEHAALRRTFIERMARNRRGAYIATQVAVLSWSVRDRVREIQAPTLVISAEHDYPFLANKQAWASEMPHAEYVEVPGAHHALPMEMPDAFHGLLADFLARHGAAADG